VNLQNAEGVGKPNIVGRKAKYCGKEYQSTAWSEDFGVVQRMLMKMDTKGHHDRDRDHY